MKASDYRGADIDLAPFDNQKVTVQVSKGYYSFIDKDGQPHIIGIAKRRLKPKAADNGQPLTAAARQDAEA